MAAGDKPSCECDWLKALEAELTRLLTSDDFRHAGALVALVAGFLLALAGTFFFTRLLYKPKGSADIEAEPMPETPEDPAEGAETD